ncbi:MAG: cytochrome c3 family protein [Planctomycetes bacterium]|nr:cytochrome c3 family protein [Planctomycetota bacterium]
MNAKLAVLFFLLTVGMAMPILLGIRSIPDIQLPNLHTGYQPEQPIPYSHRLHAGVLDIDCQYCHAGADQGRHAMVPTLDTCWNCHKTVAGRTQTAKEAIGKLRQAYMSGEGVEWKRVHNNADFVYFNHQTHVRIAKYIDADGNISDGIDCTYCHGDMAKNGVAKQEEQLAMGFCINCHRDQNDRHVAANLPARAPVNACDACHR